MGTVASFKFPATSPATRDPCPIESTHIYRGGDTSDKKHATNPARHATSSKKQAASGEEQPQT